MWNLIIVCLTQVASVNSFQHRSGNCGRLQYTTKVWLFTTVCWMAAIMAVGWSTRESWESKVDVCDSSIEEACKSIVIALEKDPGNLAITQAATSIHLSIPVGKGGEYRERLHQHIMRIAKSWDDVKSYHPLRST